MADIREFEDTDLDGVVLASLRAWEPNFASMNEVLGDAIFRRLYPGGILDQGPAVAAVCRSETSQVWVADVGGQPVGFVAVELHREKGIGEIYMLAVDPEYQNRGIGSDLTQVALRWISAQGMTIAMVETGGDVGHAAARHVYEKNGFTAFPGVRYWMDLGPQATQPV
jgi:ribosomal protein S18 acetylase RimI-like enzyme